jgi:4-hydroxy-2-oxoheptanedioate aldolase
MVQVESRSALDELDGICTVPGIDAVYIGPSDLALSLGLSSGKNHDPRTLLAIRDTARRHGVAAGMHGESGEEARWAIDNGFAITTAGADVDYLHQAARRAFVTAVGDDPDPSAARDRLDRAPRLAV